MVWGRVEIENENVKMPVFLKTTNPSQGTYVVKAMLLKCLINTLTATTKGSDMSHTRVYYAKKNKIVGSLTAQLHFRMC